MGLVSYSYYTDTYLGEPVSADDFPRYEKRAEMLVLSTIRKSTDQVRALPAGIQAMVEDAICVQIDYLYEYGVGVASYGKEAGGGYTTGKVTIHNGSSTKVDSGAASMIAPGVWVYLEQTGLLNPQVPTAPEPWPALRGWF